MASPRPPGYVRLPPETDDAIRPRGAVAVKQEEELVPSRNARPEAPAPYVGRELAPAAAAHDDPSPPGSDGEVEESGIHASSGVHNVPIGFAGMSVKYYRVRHRNTSVTMTPVANTNGGVNLSLRWDDNSERAREVQLLGDPAIVTKIREIDRAKKHVVELSARSLMENHAALFWSIKYRYGSIESPIKLILGQTDQTDLSRVKNKRVMPRLLEAIKAAGGSGSGAGTPTGAGGGPPPLRAPPLIRNGAPVVPAAVQPTSAPNAAVPQPARAPAGAPRRPPRGAGGADDADTDSSLIIINHDGEEPRTARPISPAVLAARASAAAGRGQPAVRGAGTAPAAAAVDQGQKGHKRAREEAEVEETVVPRTGGASAAAGTAPRVGGQGPPKRPAPAFQAVFGRLRGECLECAQTTYATCHRYANPNPETLNLAKCLNCNHAPAVHQDEGEAR